MRSRTFILISSLFLFANFASAQDGPPEMGGPPNGRGGRPNLMAELNLSADQIQQLKDLNRGRRPRIQDAQLRLREANRALDMAIYADAVNDIEVQTRLREFQAAQAEMARLRFENELAVRKVLTPEQLTKFRELRRRFEEQTRKFRRNGQPRPRGGRRGDGQRPPVDF
jgi:periplasmic protein CpxP/Spy